MLKNRNTQWNTFYYLAGLLGLCCVFWLMFSLKNTGNDATNQSQKQVDNLRPVISPSSEKTSIKLDLDQPINLSEQTKSVTSHIDNIDPEQCSAQCSSTLSMLDGGLALDDEGFHKLGAYTKEIAAYLQNDEIQRQHYLQMALATTDADKRRFLSDIFKHLPYQQKLELSEGFIASDNWQVRADGVTLIADHDMQNLAVADALMAIFSSEQNSYIKGSILSYIEQSSTLQGDVEILQHLDSAIYNETNPSVRVAALKAKMQLSEAPYHILPDALQALRTSEPEFQLAGLIAIEQVLAHEKKYIESGVYIDRNSIGNEFQIIRDLSNYDDDKKRFDRLIREANIIYLRYFG